ncbi:hypothetical protein FHS89_002126 [Rubricella aquisinus]|uniref:Uncharacterized protein n=1 Tax=Rubricella aquisinus TaxID=2028108 RepID=A0A840WY60_9RHOB|nr:hypothetical protein [Rubricella aquisinus]MBB5516100.1 hypothetical protein [Rubricella aquisinus]
MTDVTFLIPVLALFTMLALLIWSMFGKYEAEKRLGSKDTKPSALAKDGDAHEKNAA